MAMFSIRLSSDTMTLMGYFVYRVLLSLSPKISALKDEQELAMEALKRDHANKSTTARLLVQEKEEEVRGEMIWCVV